MLDQRTVKPKAGWGNLADVAYGTLRDLIVEGTLAPGARLRESEVSSRLKMSRTPIREAIRRLEQEGFVRTERGDERRESTRVAPLTKQDAQELFFLVGALEGVVARWVAQFPDSQRGRFCVVLEEANERLRVGAISPDADPLGVIALDRAFHQRLVDPAVGVRLTKTYEMLKPQTARYSLAYRAYWPESIDEHRVLIDAIRRGDPDGAEQAAAENYRGAAKRICGVMMVQGEKP